MGLWDPVCDADLSVLAGRGERGALHEENLLQATAALLHSPGHWHALLQRPVSAHPRGSVDAAVTHLAAPSRCRPAMWFPQRALILHIEKNSGKELMIYDINRVICFNLQPQ